MNFKTCTKYFEKKSIEGHPKQLLDLQNTSFDSWRQHIQCLKNLLTSSFTKVDIVFFETILYVLFDCCKFRHIVSPTVTSFLETIYECNPITLSGLRLNYLPFSLMYLESGSSRTSVLLILPFVADTRIFFHKIEHCIGEVDFVRIQISFIGQSSFEHERCPRKHFK